MAPESEIDGESPRPARTGLVLLAVFLLAAVSGVLVLHHRATHPRRPPIAPPHPALLTSIPRDTIPIAWRDWSEDTFAQAREHRLPVAVLFDAGWCESCRLYEGALAASGPAHRALETRVVPVRVDIDRRPDVHARYHFNFTGLPCWVLLTPGGDLWDLGDVLTPDNLVRTLEAMHNSPQALREDPGIEMLRRQVPVAHSIPDLGALPQSIFDELWAAWPDSLAPLPPNTAVLDSDALEFLRVLAQRRGPEPARRLLVETLERLVAPSEIFDPSSGRIVQDIEPTPGRVSRASLLETHAMLLEQLVHARAWDRGDTFARAAARIAAYMEGTLLDPERHLFRSAQGTLTLRDGKIVLTSAERARLGAHDSLPPPEVVPVYSVPGNARACTALLALAAAGGPDAARHRQIAIRGLDALRDLLRRSGRAVHDAVPGPNAGVVASESDFLEDYAEVGLALLSGWREDGREARLLAEASQLADTMLERFGAEDLGVLYDIPPPGALEPARMQVRLMPIDWNARAALFLFELADASGQSSYRAAGLRVLQAWSGSLQAQSTWELAAYGTSILAAQPLP